MAAPAQEKRSERPNPMAQENVQRGHGFYGRNCSGCHGAEARGGIGPTLIDSSLVRHDDNGNLIGAIVRDGRTSKGMPAFPRMNDAQVQDIAFFLHALIEVNDRRGISSPTRGISLSQLLTGNSAEGERYFSGAGGCSKCHQKTGDLKGIGKKYTPLELIGRMLYPDQGKRNVAVRLPSGEMIQGELVHLDAFMVTLNKSGTYRSWPLQSGVKVMVDDPLKAHRELLEKYRDEDIHDLFAFLETLQ
jgi:cytochrome c oxidase cbb3-type subunit 3